MDPKRVEQAALGTSGVAFITTGLAALLGLETTASIFLFLFGMLMMSIAAVLYFLYTVLVIQELLEDVDISIQSRFEPRS